jgi:hypothetical protein
LLEVGASGGLNLRWDRYRYKGGEGVWGEPDAPVLIDFELEGRPPPPVDVEVVERRGCDPRPVDPTTEEGQLTLLSFVWADQPKRLRRLRSALAVAAALPVEVDEDGAASWIAERLAEPKVGVATIVYHSIVMQYLEEEERLEFERRVREAGEAAVAATPLTWLRMEPAGEMAEVRLTCWPGGEERLLARAGYHGDPVHPVT